MGKKQPHTIVIGAGINGVSAAIWLMRSGVNVTLVDRQPPGEGTSHGNAGIIAACSIVPVTTPGLIGKAPKLLMDSDFPLFMRWRYLPKLLPWLSRYLSYANESDTRSIAENLGFAIADSVEQHQDLAGNTIADQWLVMDDYQFAYGSRADFDADHYVWSLRKSGGFEPEILEGKSVQEKEPALSDSIGLLAVMKDHAYVRSPGKYVKSLAEVFQSMGGTLKQANVTDISLIDGKVTSVETDQGSLPCDNAVLAMGVWSKGLGEKFGIKIPMESERGYHVIFKDPAHAVKSPTMIASGKFVATPMFDGLRCAGIVELGGLEAGPSSAPIELLKRHVNRTLPNLTYSDTVEWLGHRPAPVDSLPFIGEIGTTQIYTAFGHHHIGLTGGAKTGRLVAGLITGEQDEEELAPFRPDRFN